MQCKILLKQQNLEITFIKNKIIWTNVQLDIK